MQILIVSQKAPEGDKYLFSPASSSSLLLFSPHFNSSSSAFPRFSLFQRLLKGVSSGFRSISSRGAVPQDYTGAGSFVFTPFEKLPPLSLFYSALSFSFSLRFHLQHFSRRKSSTNYLIFSSRRSIFIRKISLSSSMPGNITALMNLSEAILTKHFIIHFAYYSFRVEKRMHT